MEVAQKGVLVLSYGGGETRRVDQDEVFEPFVPYADLLGVIVEFLPLFDRTVGNQNHPVGGGEVSLGEYLLTQKGIYEGGFSRVVFANKGYMGLLDRIVEVVDIPREVFQVEGL